MPTEEQAMQETLRSFTIHRALLRLLFLGSMARVVVADVRWTDLSGDMSDAPPARSGHRMVSVGNDLFVFGGRSGAASRDSRLLKYAIPSKRWSDLSEPAAGAPPSPRESFGMAATGDSIFVFGGETSGYAYRSLSNELHRYDVSKRSWEDLSLPVSGTPPAPRQGLAMAAWGDSLFVMGGYVGRGEECLDSMENELYEYVISEGRWRLLPARRAIGSRKSHSMAAADGYLYVFGGVDTSPSCPPLSLDNTLYRFKVTEPRDYEWRLLDSEMNSGARPPQRFLHGMAAAAGSIWVFGGRTDIDDHGPRDDHLWQYVVSSKVWGDATPPALARSFARWLPAAAASGASLFFFGGWAHDDSGTLFQVNLCNSAAGEYCPDPGSADAVPCPAGSFCDGTTPFPVRCTSPGEYCPAAAAAPEPCAVGYRCSGGDTMELCRAGSYCPLGAAAEEACPLNNFCPPGSERPSPCEAPTGSYCPARSSVARGTACPPFGVNGTDCACLAGFSLRLGRGSWVQSESRVNLRECTLAFWWQREVSQADGVLLAIHDDAGDGSVFVSVRGMTITLETAGVEVVFFLPVTNTTGWEHVAMSYDTAGAKLYVGGSEVATATLNATLTEPGSGFLFVGQDPTGKRKDAAGVKVDEVLAFSSILSPLEVLHTMQNDLTELPAPSSHITFDSLELLDSEKVDLEEHSCGLIHGQVLGCYQMMRRGRGMCPDVKNESYCMLFVHSVLIDASGTDCDDSQPCLDSNMIRDSSSFLFWVNLSDMAVELLSSSIVFGLLVCGLRITDRSRRNIFRKRALGVEIIFQLAATVLTGIEVARVYDTELQDALERLYSSRCVERNNDGIVTDLKNEFQTLSYLAPAELVIAAGELVFSLYAMKRISDDEDDDRCSMAVQSLLDILQALVSVIDFYLTIEVTGSVDAMFESVNARDDVWCYEGQRLDAMCTSSATTRISTLYWISWVIIFMTSKRK